MSHYVKEDNSLFFFFLQIMASQTSVYYKNPVTVNVLLTSSISVETNTLLWVT